MTSELPPAGGDHHSDVLALLRCPACGQPLRQRADDLACVGCHAAYPVDDGIIDLRMPDVDAHKQRQEQFFSDEADAYERDVVNSRFYQALDALTVQRWAAALPPQSLVLDVGSGTGRVAIALARLGHRVIAIDLTPALLRRARTKARAAGVDARIVFVLADAETLPLAAGRLDAAAAHGVLHHLEQPQRLIAQVARALRPDGSWFSLDPHRSPLRGIFDAAMRRRPLWQEEAAPDALQTEDRLRTWCRSAGIEPRIGYSCYVLPHLLASLPKPVVQFVLGATDALLRRSILRRLAGVIVVSGTRTPVHSTADAESFNAAMAIALFALVALSGVWHAERDVAARSASYYMGGLESMLAHANAPARYGSVLVTTTGDPLEAATLDDVGYMLALQLAAASGAEVTAGRLAEAHAVAFALASLLFATAVAVRYRSAIAGFLVLAALLVLASRLSMLIYGQVSNQTATSIFPPLMLGSMLVALPVLTAPSHRHSIALAGAALGALTGTIDLVRHSHGLAIMLTLGPVLLCGVRGSRRRFITIAALLAGYVVATIIVPAGLKVHRDIRLRQWEGLRWSYLQRPPAHHIWYTLLTAVGRYPNALGLRYEDRSVDDFIRTRSPAGSAVGEADRVAAARSLFFDYVRRHPGAYARTLAAGVGELGPFLAYTTFMAPPRWDYAWPSIVPGLDVERGDVARYGTGLLMNVRARYLRLSVSAWMLFGAALAALFGAAVHVLASWRSGAPSVWIVAAALLYLLWVALPRALVPVQGMDFVFAFWCVALLSGTHLLVHGPRGPLEAPRHQRRPLRR